MNLSKMASLACAAAVLCASSAAAQSTYVAASVFGDVVRSSHVSGVGITENSGGGEAIGFALRIGTPVGTAWGVEAEFARPSLIEEESDRSILPLLQTTPNTIPGTTFPDVRLIAPVRVRTTQRHTTLSTTAWVQQQLSSRVSLVYIGGLAFYRSVSETETNYGSLATTIPIVLPPFQSEFVAYGVRPLVGLESRIALTDKAQLVPGIRLLATDGAWLIRPAVGIAWLF